MEDFNVTKLPFTSISRENWMMLKRLDRDSAYDALQMIASYVIDGVEASYDGIAGMVAEQVVSVIKRKGQKSFNSKNNLNKANAALQEKKEKNDIEPNQDFDPQFSNPVVIEELKQHKTNEYDFNTIDDVAQYLAKVRKEKGRDSYFGEMNYIGKQTDFDFNSINDLMVSRYGYR